MHSFLFWRQLHHRTVIFGSCFSFFKLSCWFAASGAYIIDDLSAWVWKDFFHTASRSSCYSFSLILAKGEKRVPIRKKMWNIFSKFWFTNFWRIFEILHLSLVSAAALQQWSSLVQQASVSVHIILVLHVDWKKWYSFKFMSFSRKKIVKIYLNNLFITRVSFNCSLCRYFNFY